MRLAALLIIGAVLGSAGSAAAREITPAEEREAPFDTLMPLCHDPAVLARITARFAEKEARFWTSPLTIEAYERIRPVAWRPWGLDFIPRRFCTGTAITSDGRRRRIDYSVREDLELTLFGNSWGVEWCVQGLDRNYAYAPNCKMARP